MKKLLYIFISILLLGCSSSEDSSNSSKNSLNPPTWIQGKWAMGTGDAESGYEFKSNDWCSYMSGFSTCWKGAIESSNGQTTVDETITDSSYITKLTVGGVTITYTFIKMSATKIRASSSGVSLYYDKK
jgi:hypothetical protein